MGREFTHEDFWKNFNMGTELDVSGTFIYNGLKSFHDMQTFYHEADVFDFLYNISVGIERLFKIVIILTEHNETVDQEAFEKELITHNHLELFHRIQERHNVNVSNPHNKFLQILTNFYKSMRYDRYCLAEVRAYNKEKKALIDFICTELNIEYSEEFLSVTQNDERCKKFIGKIIGKFCKELYKIVQQEAHRLGLFTYELRYESKAAKIFLANEFDFINEDRVRKELLIFLMHAESDTGVVNYIKSNMRPLELDIGEACEYIECFQNLIKTTGKYETVRMAYEEEVEDSKARLAALDAFTDCHAFYFEDEDE